MKKKNKIKIMTRYSVQNLFVHTVQSGVVPTLIRPSTETKQCKYTVTDFDKKKNDDDGFLHVENPFRSDPGGCREVESRAP